MPLYEFRCETCGDFDAWRSMAEATAPMLCPECETTATRIFSAPNISLNSGSLSKYTQEPRLVKRDRSRPPSQIQHSSQPNQRPWMISH